MGGPSATIYVFGPFRLDPQEGTLIRDGQAVPLTPKTFAVLLTLVQRHGHLVVKADLLASVWPDTAVEESNLAQNVFVLRRVLGEGANGKPYIETVPKRGYRFVAPVEEIGDEQTAHMPAREARPQIPPEAPTVPETVGARVNPDEGPAAAAATTRSAMRLEHSSPRVPLAVATLTGVVVATVWWLAIGPNRQHGSGTAGRLISIERVTTTGRATVASVSPDGRYVAYVLDEGRHRSLWTRDLHTGSQLQVVAPDAVDYWSLVFDRSGAYVYATIWEWNKTNASIIRVPVLGGDLVHVLEDSTGGAVSFSPDGQSFVQIETSDRLANSGIVVHRIDGSVERTVAIRRDPESFQTSYNSKPAWSPDGQSVASGIVVRRGKTPQNTLIAVDVRTGSETRLTRSSWDSIGPLVWLSDGRIVFVARAVPTSSLQVWELWLSEDVVRPLTAEPMDYDALTATDDGSILVAVRTERSIGIFTGPGDGRGEYRQIAAEVGVPRQADAFSWTPDGRIVYASTAAGPMDLWIVGHDGSGRRRLTADAARDFHPSVSPDGASLVYASDRNGAISLWKVGLDGRGATQVTEGDGTGDVYPSWFPDGNRVVFQRGYAWGEAARLATVTLGSKAELFTTQMSLRPVVSPDGRRLACFRMDPAGWRLVVMSVDDGRELAMFTPPRSSKSRTVRWTPDGSGLAYIDAPDGIDNIWIQPVGGGSPSRLTYFESGSPIEHFEWSRDGATLGITRQTLTSDVVRITGSKPTSSTSPLSLR